MLSDFGGLVTDFTGLGEGTVKFSLHNSGNETIANAQISINDHLKVKGNGSTDGWMRGMEKKWIGTVPFRLTF